jgi:hypothetical protein
VPKEEPPLLPLALSKRQRWAAAVVGVTLFGAGGVAVFQAENDFSTVALLAGGVVFSMMALTGYGLTRLRIGQAEVEFQAFREARQLILDGNEEGAERVLYHAAARSRPLGTEPQPLLPRTSPADYERQVLNTIDSLFPSARVTSQPEGTAHLDGLIEIDRRRIGVDVRAGSRFIPGYVLTRIDSMFADTTASLDALLIVIRSPSDDPDTDRLRSAVQQKEENNELTKPVLIIAWMPQDPVTVLHDALESLLNKLGRGAG